MSENASRSVTAVLADDHAIVRAALRVVLESKVGFEVVAEAGDVATTVRKVSGYKPDLLMLDVNLPDGSGIEAIPRLRDASPRTAIVVLTIDHDLTSARTAIRAGAVGYALKEAADSELIDAARAAIAGHTYLDPELGAAVAIDEEEIPGTQDGLSRREVEVLRLLAAGYSNREIADQLGLTVRTIETHRSHLQHKIGRYTRAEVTAYARAHDPLSVMPRQ